MTDCRYAIRRRSVPSLARRLSCLSSSVRAAALPRSQISLIISGFGFFRLDNSQEDVLPKIGVLFFIPINASFRYVRLSCHRVIHSQCQCHRSPGHRLPGPTYFDQARASVGHLSRRDSLLLQGDPRGTLRGHHLVTFLRGHLLHVSGSIQSEGGKRAERQGRTSPERIGLLCVPRPQLSLPRQQRRLGASHRSRQPHT